MRLATQAMGTRFELVLVGADEAHLRAAGEEALAEIEECDRRLSLFRSDSLLSHLNRSGALRPVRTDADTYALFELCAEVHAASQGAFDPTIAPLMEAHGFRGAVGDVAAARAHVGWNGVELDPEHASIRFARAGVTLDLGAIGKGHGLDLAARVLREAGIESALLHGGTSTVVAVGAPPGEPGWRVALARGADAPCATLRDCALSVSAPHGRTTQVGGRELGHVLDPQSGQPAEGTCLAAAITALESGAALADAWSTALLVRGTDLARHNAIETLHATGSLDAPAWHFSRTAGEARFALPAVTS
jgi:FAD:protein FMN transferase